MVDIAHWLERQIVALERPWVRTSIIHPNKTRRHSQVVKAEDCNSFTPSSNLGAASTIFYNELFVPIAQPDRVFDYESKGRGSESLGTPLAMLSEAI